MTIVQSFRRSLLQPRTNALGILLGCMVSILGRGATADDQIFERDVKPILAKHCIDCHSADETKAKLDLSNRDHILFGSEGGYVVTPGKASASLLTQLVAKESKPHMPPAGQLSDEEIATLSKWIDSLEGTTLPTRPTTTRGRNHWTLQPAVRRPLPSVKKREWVKSPIDHFVLAKMEASELAPSKAVARSDLIRRAYLDLIGLPPSPEEVQAFSKDESPDAFERLLDRLLASPAYGERWGRHWLDLARYGDSSGFHDDIDRPHAWRYRDYVIRSLNDDKPFADFVREQLSGDEAATVTADSLAATGFCLCGPSNENNMGQEKERYRLEQLDDVISTASAVFLGQTIGCARCHDHKFDPISQADYYRFLAIFNSTMRVETPLDELGIPQPPVAKEKPKVAVTTFTDTGNKPRATHVLFRGDLNNRGPEVQPGVPVAFVSQPLEFKTPAAESKTTGRRQVLSEWVVSSHNPLTWRVIANRLWQHHFGRGIVATPSNFGLTGAPPSHPELLDWLSLEMVDDGGSWKRMHRRMMSSASYRQSSISNVDGATVDPENLLLWRMNKLRLEAEVIRDSILAVAGTLNARQGGPGIKPRIQPELLVSSQRNKWPLVEKEGPQHWRRSVYIYVKRQLPFPLLELFDSPSTSQTCERRETSTVPTQALVLMNDEFTQSQASYFADRVRNEAGPDLKRQAERALWVALGQSPSATRVADAASFLRQQQQAHEKNGIQNSEALHLALTDLCHVLMNCNEFLYVD